MSSVYALIENNRVTNLITAAGPDSLPGFLLLPAAPHTAIGDALINGKLPGPKVLTLEEVRALKLAAIAAETGAAITHGFFYEIQGQPYFFSYDTTDQGNFTKASVSATLALTQGIPWTQIWRGWQGETPHILTLSLQEFLGLATYAGKDHQESCLAAGWARQDAAMKAQTINELESI